MLQKHEQKGESCVGTPLVQCSCAMFFLVVNCSTSRIDKKAKGSRLASLGWLHKGVVVWNKREVEREAERDRDRQTRTHTHTLSHTHTHTHTLTHTHVCSYPLALGAARQCSLFVQAARERRELLRVVVLVMQAYVPTKQDVQDLCDLLELPVRTQGPNVAFPPPPFFLKMYFDLLASEVFVHMPPPSLRLCVCLCCMSGLCRRSLA